MTSLQQSVCIATGVEKKCETTDPQRHGFQALSSWICGADSISAGTLCCIVTRRVRKRARIDVLRLPHRDLDARLRVSGNEQTLQATHSRIRES